MPGELDILFDEDYIDKKRNKIGFSVSNVGFRKYLHFPQAKDKFVLIPNFKGHGIDSIKEVDVHFVGDEKSMCLRTIGKPCSVCDFLDNISDYKSTYKEIDEIRRKLFARTYGLVPVLLLKKPTLDEAIKYSRWNIFMLTELYDDYIRNREYGKKCLQFEIGFEVTVSQIQNDQEFFKLEPFIVRNLKFSIKAIQKQYENFPDAFEVFSKGLGYITDKDDIKKMLEEYVSNSKQAISTQKDLTKPSEEFVDDNILEELDEIEDQTSTEEEDLDNSIDEIFDDVENEVEETEDDLDDILDLDI